MTLMLHLDALKTDEWTVVARRIRGPKHTDTWNWFLESRDQGALHMGVEGGRYLLVNQRDPQTGQWRLLARVARPVGAKGARPDGRHGCSPVEASRGLWEG